LDLPRQGEAGSDELLKAQRSKEKI
jgi:hypothetical protein